MLSRSRNISDRLGGQGGLYGPLLFEMLFMCPRFARFSRSKVMSDAGELK
jgi:hypothetical protein